jgi:biopolymer transport protein ExbD
VRKRRRYAADVDITSLIDMMFMLIIFFVLTTSFVQGVAQVDLPNGDAPSPAGSPVVITVTEGSGLLWSGEAISRDGLPPRVAGVLSVSGDILIAADRNVPYGEVAELLDDLRGLGVSSVGLAFEGSARRGVRR